MKSGVNLSIHHMGECLKRSFIEMDGHWSMRIFKSINQWADIKKLMTNVSEMDS